MSIQAPVSDDLVAVAAERSPLRLLESLSPDADREELRFRNELEPIEDPVRDVPAWIERKELVRKLDYALQRGGLRPAGTIVDLGAGTCWLSATLARRPEVERVIAVDFSKRRLVDLAPVALAYQEAPPEKVERIVADFYRPGVELEVADMVFTDAAFHHAADPQRLTRVAYELLKPGGQLVLHREPTLALLRRTRDHGIEDNYGSFEREYDRREYLGFLRGAGFEARSFKAAGGFSSLRARALLRAPLSWLNGIAYSEFTYVGRKPVASGV